MGRNKTIDSKHLREYVLINHHFMTCQEMAEEKKCHYQTIYKLCVELGVVAITVKQRNLEFIKSHPRYSLEKICQSLGIEKDAVKLYFKELGLHLRTDKKPPEELTDEEIEERLNKLRTPLGFAPSSGKKRIKESYTQSSSPFGLATKLYGIQTK